VTWFDFLLQKTGELIYQTVVEAIDRCVIIYEHSITFLPSRLYLRPSPHNVYTYTWTP